MKDAYLPRRSTNTAAMASTRVAISKPTPVGWPRPTRTTIHTIFSSTVAEEHAVDALKKNLVTELARIYKLPVEGEDIKGAMTTIGRYRLQLMYFSGQNVIGRRSAVRIICEQKHIAVFEMELAPDRFQLL
jgi:hypothetical protein